MHQFRLPAGILLVFLAVVILTVSGTSKAGGDPNDADISQKEVAMQPDPRIAAFHDLQRRELHSAVRAYFEKAIASGEIVGAGVSIVHAGTTVLSDGFGKRDAREDLPVNGQTVFRLGSLSKGFAGILAVKLNSEGKLGWDDRVRDYIPDFRLGDQQNTDRITLGHIMSHSSGAPYHSYTNLVEAGLPLGEIAARFKEVKPISEPGQMYSYQNALYALSAEIMHKATGQEIGTSLQEQLFKPLEMCSTNANHQALLASGNIARPHVRGRNRWIRSKLNDHYYNAIAAGGINASPSDMGRWMGFLLGHRPDVMDSGTIQKAFEPVVEIPGRSKYYQRWAGHTSSHYGYGWRIHKYQESETEREKTIWHHGGSVNGFRNEIALFPEDDLGICVLLNSNSRLARDVIPDLYRIVEEVYGEMQPSLSFDNQITETNPEKGSGGHFPG